MYNLAVLAQVLLTIVCLEAVFVMAFKKASSYSNVIIIAFICVFIQNAGYILELLSKNVDEAMVAVRVEYLGGAFEIGLITFFMFKYCGHEFNLPLKLAFLLEGIIVLFSVWTWNFNSIYYTDVTFVSDAIIPHLSMQHGFMYYAFSAMTVVELISCIFILVVSILKTNQKHMRYNYTVLLFVVLIPLFGFVFSVTNIFHGFDATPASAAVAVGLFAVAIVRHHVFDVADAAGDSILNNMENAIIIINSEFGYEYSNERAKSLFPALKTYKRGAIIKEFAIKNLFDDKQAGQTKIEKRTFEVSVTPVIERGIEIGKTAILFDVTDSILQLEKMRELMSEAEEANRTKSAFLASVSHEIRTPINVIMGMSEVLIRDHSTEETKDYLSGINSSSKTLLNLINDIIDFAKIDSGKIKINSERFDLKRQLSEIVSVYRFRCEQKGLDFEYDISGDIPRHVIGDVARIRQVITNVLSNALKSTNEGSIKLKIGHKYRSDFDVDLIIAVEDSSEGIKREEYDKLFDDIDKSNNNSLGNDSGLGLGISITKQLVELMGGIINLRTSLEHGSIFSMVIPVIAVTDNIETADETIGTINKEKEFKPSFIAPMARILVVDDLNLNLIVVKELLKGIKSEVVTVDSGEKCLEIIKNERFDLILLDHRMPGMDGVETFSRMKAIEHKCEGVPVIIHTANADLDSRKFYVSRGFTDFLSKPTTEEQLVTMLYKYLPEELIEN